MKVLLINPGPYNIGTAMPLGLGYIAAFLEKNKVDVDVIDADALKLSTKDLIEQVVKINPDIVGITSNSLTLKVALMIIKSIKEKLPDTKIALGGPHASDLPKETLLEIPELDFVVRGEGELTMLELVNAVKSKKELNEVNGIAFRSGKDIVLTGPRSFIEDLDTIPFPAWHKFPMNHYRIHPPYGRERKFMNVITSRGCPYSCAFCSKAIFGKKLRMRSAKNVVDEIEQLVKLYGTKEIHFYDDDFTLDMGRAEKICDELIKRKIRIIWSCTTRVDLVDDNLLKKMKKAGCWMISYGVESASDDILKTMNKGVTVHQIESAFKLTKKNKINTLAFFIAGLPGETKETLKKSFDFSLRLDPDFVSWGTTLLFPNTPMNDIVKKGNIKQLPLVSNNKFFSILDKNEHVFLLEENLSTAEIEKAVTNNYRKFYLRPKYMLKRILGIRSVYELNHYLKAGLSLIK